MSTSAVIYITGKGVQSDFNKIKDSYLGSHIFACPVGDGTEIHDANIMLPEEVVGNNYNDYAFCLTTEELFCFLSLEFVIFFMNSYKTIVVISDNGMFSSLPEDENTINVFPYLLEHKDRNSSIDISLGSRPLYCNYSFALKYGKQISEFLVWGQKKYNRILFNGVGDRRFLKTWLSYATLFGCGIKLLEKAVSIDFSGYEMYQCFENGISIPDVLREYFGTDYRLRTKCKSRPLHFPDYFIQDTIVVGDSQTIPVTAIEKAIYCARKDLQSLFPDLNNPKMRVHFTEWFLGYAQKEYRLSEEYISPIREAYVNYQKVIQPKNSIKRFLYNRKTTKIDYETKHPFGVNLCGFIKGDFGLGESIRILARVLQHTNIPYTIIEVQDSGLHMFSNTEFENKISNEFRYSINIFAYNPDCFEETIREFDKSIFYGRRNIGYWAWEMLEFPEGWEREFPYFDEIWTLSDFTTQSIAQEAPIPVYTVPYAIYPEKDEVLSRMDFGLPENQFIFLMTYDTRSVSERKNPMAAVRAFNKAFGNSKEATLLLKLNTPLDWEGDKELVNVLDEHNNILTINQQMSKVEINSLISLCDAYVSLHRSEGFGLGPAEAMAFGKPAILTNYSGNTQYMRDGACCPVPYRLVTVEEDFGIYRKGMHWAEPDEEVAAEYMKKLVDDKCYYASIGKNAKQVIETEFSYEHCGKILLERLGHLK